MAPFDTHFLVAENLWPELLGPWQAHFDQFCFGCVAPDVDKISATLTQKDTHFFDRTTDWDLMASHRTATFLKELPNFIGCPFDDLEPEAQAFVMGYLCHLCVDEISKYMWRRSTWQVFKDVGPGAAFAALDEQAARYIQDYPAIIRAINHLRVLDLIPRIPITDLQRYYQGVNDFVSVPTIEAKYVALLGLFGHQSPESVRGRQRVFLNAIRTARRHVYVFKLELMLKASLERSRYRINDLLASRIPEPSLPILVRE
jgi:hypothetical protein